MTINLSTIQSKVSDYFWKKNLRSMDRLSSLPDDIICDILSFLPTKTSVRTSILSKRWSCLWTRVPALEFSGSRYDTEMVNSENIRKVMWQHKLNIDTFRLDCRQLHLSCYELESWIDNITARNVRNLVLKIDNPIKFPRCLFTSKTLVYLSLINVDVCSGDVRVGCGVYLPVLKKLELVETKFDSEETLPRLLFGCPVLEELVVDILGSLNKVVCSPTITKLTISSTGGYVEEPYKMKLDVPALRYLRLSADSFEIFSSGTLSSLNEADVDFVDYGCTGDVEEEKIILCSRSILEFLGKLSNVRCLKLSTCGLMISNDTFSELAPKFHKLTQLELRGDDCRFIPFFLENANNLRLLTIDFLEVWFFRRNLNWRDPKQVPACLISHLETVNFVNFEWDTERDFDMIRYILRNGKVLKMLKITRYRSHELDCTKKLEVLNRLASFELERGLKTCQVAFD